MKIVNLSQRSPAWHAWRARGVTASEAAVILGRSPYQTPWRLWAEKTGLCAPVDRSQNPFVQRGRQCEDAARRGFEERHRTWLLPVCAESSTHPVLRCSFDGLTDAGEPVELKVPGQRIWAQVARDGTASGAYRLYWVQVQFQCYVAEAARGWLVFDPVQPSVPAREFEILRDAAFLEQELVPACRRFAELLASGEAPLPDPVRDQYVPQGDQRAAWQRQAQAYRRAASEATRLEGALKAVKGRMSEAQAGLVALMGESLLADQDGVQVLRYHQRGSIDHAALLAALAPDLDPQVLEAHRRPGTTRVKVTLRDADGDREAGTDAARGPRRRRQSTAPVAEAATASSGAADEGDLVVGYF